MIKLFVPPFIYLILKRIRFFYSSFLDSSFKDKEYYLDGTKIILPHNHNLDVFQKTHLKYDALIRIIASNIPVGSIVIDVGANIGDSAIPFLKKRIKTVCIEPSGYFLRYLEKNLNMTGFAEDCIVVNALVSTSSQIRKLNLYHGTASVSDAIDVVEKSENIVNILTLNEICIEYPEIEFIKIDTDGYDYDVILSGIDTFKSKMPLLLFECYVNKENLFNYEMAFDMLADSGYDNIYVFDNFGNLILNTDHWNTVKCLNKYIVDTKSSIIGYLDVFCFGKGKSQIGDLIIGNFLNNFEND